MESSPLNRTSSVPAMLPVQNENPTPSTRPLLIESLRAIGKSYLSQGRSKSKSLKSVFSHPSQQIGPSQAKKTEPPSTWSKLQGKSGCLMGEAARIASGLDVATLKAASTTANLLSCVIAIRHVASGAVDAMRNGAVPKGLNIKGKSANFGPHNALIPRDPRLSKVWRDSEKTVELSLKNEKALESGQVYCTPLQLDEHGIKALVEKGLIKFNPNELRKSYTLIHLTALDSPEHPVNPAVAFRLTRIAPGQTRFAVEYRHSSDAHQTEENWRPLEVLANEQLKPYTADFDLFTVMPATNSPLLREELDNYRHGSARLDEKYGAAQANPCQSPEPRVFNFENIEGLDSPSQAGTPNRADDSIREIPARQSSIRSSITRSPLPRTPVNLYPTRHADSISPNSKLPLNMSKLQLAAHTVVSMLGHSERLTPQSEVGRENFWESQVRQTFNTAHKSMTRIQVDPVKHGNEQNNPMPEAIENITFIKPDGEIWFAENEPAAMAMIYMAQEDGHLGYLNVQYDANSKDENARYLAGVNLAKSER